MMFVAAIVFIAAAAGVVWFICACSIVSQPRPEDDHEIALSAERARRREGDAGRPAGGPVPAVSARQSWPRDPVLGIDQARAEVRERIRRYNQREVMR